MYKQESDLASNGKKNSEVNKCQKNNEINSVQFKNYNHAFHSEKSMIGSSVIQRANHLERGMTVLVDLDSLNKEGLYGKHIGEIVRFLTPDNKTTPVIKFANTLPNGNIQQAFNEDLVQPFNRSSHKAQEQGKLLISVIASDPKIAGSKIHDLTKAMLGNIEKSAFVSTTLLNTEDSKSEITFYNQRKLGFLIDGSDVEKNGAILGAGNKDLQVESKYKRVDPTDGLRKEVMTYLEKKPCRVKGIDKLKNNLKISRKEFIEYNEVYIELNPSGVIGLVNLSADDSSKGKNRAKLKKELEPMREKFKKLTNISLPLFVFNKQTKKLNTLE